MFIKSPFSKIRNRTIAVLPFQKGGEAIYTDFSRFERIGFLVGIEHRYTECVYRHYKK